MSVENLKLNAKYQYRRKRKGNNLKKLRWWKIFDLRSDLKLTLTLSLTLGLGLGLTPGITMSVENLKPNAKHQYPRKRKGNNLKKLCWWKIFDLRSDLKLTLTLSLTLGLGLGLTRAKTMSVENLKPNAKHEYRRKRKGNNLKKLCWWKIFYLRSDLKLTLSLSLTLGLELGLSPGKTMSVENLKLNAKYQYRRKRKGNNLKKLCWWKIFDLWSDLKLTLTLSLTLGLGLGLTPGITMSVENLKPNAKHQYARKHKGNNLKKLCWWKIFDLRSDLKLTLTLSLTLGLGLGLTRAKTMSDEKLKPNAKHEYRRKRKGNNLKKLCWWKIFDLRSDLKLTLTLSLTLGLELGLTPSKTKTVENLKPNAKHEHRRKRPGKNL